ncbi:MAG: nucleotide exchange factor GrpE [Patescibacteria group bacterium]
MSENILIKDDPESEETKAVPATDHDYKKLAAEYLTGWQRARADYQNFKKETEQKIGEYIVTANQELMRELLPLVDYFKHAFKHLPAESKGSDWVEGIRQIQSKLEQVLAYHGVKEMEVIGEKFNPELHESAEEVERAGETPGTIVEELRTGFMLHNKVLQAARVKIVSG